MPAQTAPACPLTVSVGVQCHPGSVRTENQDRISRSSTPFGDLYVVADGVGGYQSGAEAAQATVDGFARELTTHAALSLTDALEAAAQAINRDLDQRGQTQDPPVKMSSTAVVALIQGHSATIAHVGDSRAYLARDGKLRQITRDHSVMQRLIDQGVVGLEEAEEHPSASVLTQALGQAEDVRLEVSQVELVPDDGLLLCSDGLWGYTSDAEMEAVAASPSLSAQGCADALLQLALQGGGGDNIGIQCLKFSARQTPLHRRRIFAVPPRILMSVGAYLAVLAVAAAGLTGWNYFHGPLDERARKLLAGTSPAGSAGTPTLGSSQEYAVPVRVIRDGQAEARWAVRLPTLGYLDVTSSEANAGCLALEKDRDMLYYKAAKEATAARIRMDLGLRSQDVAELQPDNNECGAGELFALPARHSVPGGLQNKAQKSTSSVEDGIKKF